MNIINININVAKKPQTNNSSESWFERNRAKEEYWACQKLQQIVESQNVKELE